MSLGRNGSGGPSRHGRRIRKAVPKRYAAGTRLAVESLERRAMLAGDWAEPNDTSAYVIGHVEGSLTYKNVSIHSSSDDDWFSFSIPSGSDDDDYARIKFDDSDGDLDMELYWSYNSHWYKLDSSEGSDDSEEISLDGRPGGTYMVHVYGYDGDTNPAYSLKIAAPGDYERNDYPWQATNFVTIRDEYTFGRHSIDAIDAATLGDWYAFDLPRGGLAGNFAAIDFDDSDGDLDLRLYDQNLNLINESSGTDDREEITLNRLVPGHYYVQVYGYAGATNPDYALTINTAPPRPDRLESNDTPSTARNLGTVQGRRVEEGLSISSPLDADWFRFTTAATSRPGDRVGISFDGAVGDLDLELYGAGGQLIGWSRGSGDAEGISLAGLPAGTYYARVYGFYGSTIDDYTLTLDTPRVLAPDARESNDTRSTATNLGAIAGHVEIPDLSIHATRPGVANDDWFRFNLTSPAIAGHNARIEFDAALGDLDLELYNGATATTSVRHSGGIAGVEQISLAGLPAGTYYLRAFGFAGATNPEYRLIVDAPGGTNAGDAYEPNNSRGSAHDLGTLRGYQEWGTGPDDRLSIHDGDDQDWFRIRTTATGVAGNEVDLAFDHGLGDLDLELYDASGSRIASSAGVSDSESLSLAGLDPAVYYIRVYGYARAANPVYSLAVRAPGGDRFETAPPNDTAAQATVVNGPSGNLQGLHTWEHLSIGDGDVDWMKFTLARPGRAGDMARIDLLHELGDLDLQLYAASDTSRPLRSSAGVSDREEVSLAGLAAGTYYVRVFGLAGATNPDYTLTIDAPQVPVADWAEQNDSASAAKDLGTIDGFYDESRPLSIEAAGDDDWFKFRITRAGQAPHFAAISLNHAEGDLDLELYSSSNTRTPIARSSGVSNLQSVSLDNLAVGVYFLRVYGYNRETNPSYTLTINAPAALRADALEGNDTAATARDLRTIAGRYTQADLSIHTTSDRDWFRFRIGAEAGDSNFAGISFDPALGDLDVRLYAADRTTLLASSATTSRVEEVSLRNLRAGVYYLQVAGYRGATNPSYSLVIDAPVGGGDWAESNETAQTARDLRQVEGDESFTGLSIHATTDRDWFRFETLASGAEGDYVGILSDYKLGDLDIELYRSSNTATPIRYSRGVTDSERISLAGLGAGVYYLKVVGFRDATNPNYSIAMAAPRRGARPDWAEPNNTSSVAENLQTIQGFRAWSDLSIHAGDSDWFRFAITGAGVEGQFVGIAFDNSLGDLSLELYAGDNRTTPLARSTGAGNQEILSLARRAAGTYYVRVIGATRTAANPGYVLGINAPAAPAADYAEGNDARLSAYDLREVFGPMTLDDLSIHKSTDQDWFRIQTVAPGLAGQYVRIEAPFRDGNLELALYNSSGVLLANSATSRDFEEISLQGQAAGPYYVRVRGTAGSVAPRYTLSILAPQSATSIQADWAESNDTRATAYDLRQGVWTPRTDRSLLYEDAPGFGDLYGGYSSSPSSLSLYSSGNPLIDLNVGIFRREIERQQSQWINENWAAIDAHTVSSVNAGLGFLHVLDPYNFPTLGAPLSAPQTLLQQAAERQRAADQARRDELNRMTWQLQYQQAANQANTAFGNQVATIASILNLPTTNFSSILGGALAGLNQQAAPVLSYGGYASPLIGSLLNDGFGLFGIRAFGGEVGSIAGLSIHNTSDVDWFRFQLTSPGVEGQFIGLESDSTLGDLQLGLYDSAGALIEQTTGGGDRERIGLERLAAGTYYVRVRGVSGATNPNYSLMMNAASAPTPTPDWSEPNEAIASPRDLRTIEGTVTVDGLSISSATDRDVFSFTTRAASVSGHSVRLSFDHGLGDLDLQLFNASGTLLATSAGVGDVEEISMAGRAAGAYYVVVRGYAGALNPSYALTFDVPRVTPVPDGLEPNDGTATAADLANASGTTDLSGLTITAATATGPADVDYFRFTTTATATAGHFLAISFDQAVGDLQLQLVNATGAVVRASTSSVGGERVDLSGLAAGTYYAKVRGGSAAVANTYSLHLDAPTALVTARDAWTILVYMSVGDLEGPAFRDINEMELAAAGLPADVNIVVLYDQSAAGTTYATGNGTQPAWGGTGRGVIRADRDPNRIATTFDRSIGEQNTGSAATLSSFITWATRVAPADRYALIMWDHGNGFRGFNLDNMDRAGSDFLTTAELNSALSSTASIFRPSLIAFDACLMAMAEVGYSLRTRADLIVASEENEGPEGYDYATALATLARQPRLVDASRLGSAFVQSYQDQYRGDRGGADTHSAARAGAYAGLTNALKTFVNAALTLGTARDWDLIRQAGSAAAAFGISLSGEPGYRDLRQFVAWIGDNTGITAGIRSDANSVGSALSTLMTAIALDGRHAGGQSIYLPSPGSAIDPEYSAQYSAFFTATATSSTAPRGWLSFLRRYVAAAPPRGLPADWSESNEVSARAFDLGTLTGNGLTFSSLSIHRATPAGGTTTDRDWFRFEIAAVGAAGNRVTVAPVGTRGPLRLSLYDASGSVLLARSAVGDGAQTLSLSGRARGGYRILVETANGAPVANYTLTINAPTPTRIPSDWARGNDTRAKARDLGVINAETVVSGLNLERSTAQDWFNFTTPRLDGSTAGGTNVLHIKTTAGQSLTVNLYSATGRFIRAISGAGNLALSYTLGDAATYSLRVRGTIGTYSLHFERPRGPASSRSIGDATITEGSGRTVNAASTVQRSSAGGVAVPFALVSGDATRLVRSQTSLTSASISTGPGVPGAEQDRPGSSGSSFPTIAPSPSLTSPPISMFGPGPGSGRRPWADFTGRSRPKSNILGTLSRPAEEWAPVPSDLMAYEEMAGQLIKKKKPR